MRPLFALFVGLLLLTGCATVSSQRPVANPEQAWEQHKAALQAVNNWHLNGRLALRTEAKGWHASLDWRQQAGEYHLQIDGPLGSGSVRLDGDAHWVVLKASNGQSAVSADPEQLLYRELGWHVPIESLRYWVLGLPAPAPGTRQLDDQGRLARLKQQGWDIRFLDYQTVNGIPMPGRVFASQGDTDVRLVIGNWDLGKPGAV